MIKITKEKLEAMGACQDGIEWFVAHKITSLRPLVSALLKDDKASYARWLLSRLMTRPQKVKWAIYSAEQTLKLFEKKYPDDKRPRLAIKAAKDFLAGKINAYAAAYAANAAYAAAYAAYAAANAAAYAAYAAYAAAYADNAAYAAYAAYAAAYAVAYATGKNLDRKLMDYALKLLGE